MRTLKQEKKIKTFLSAQSLKKEITMGERRDK